MYNFCRVYYFNVPTFYVKIDKRESFQCKQRCGWKTGDLDESQIDAETVSKINNATSNEDLKIRIIRLIEAINISKNHDTSNPLDPNVDNSVLRIFIVPEFYFRQRQDNYCIRDTYTKNDYDNLCNFFQNYFKYQKDTFKNWIFLCGTCVFKDGRFSKNEMPVFSINKKGNFQFRSIRKLYTSKIDGIEEEEDYNKALEVANSKKLKDSSTHHFKDFNLFVEICLESYLGVLANYRKNFFQKINFHVMSAAGMPLDKMQKTSYQNFIIRNDGSVSLDMISFAENKPNSSPTPNIITPLFIEKSKTSWEDIRTNEILIKMDIQEEQGISRVTNITTVYLDNQKFKKGIYNFNNDPYTFSSENLATNDSFLRPSIYCVKIL